MGRFAQQAVANHKNRLSCSASVLSAFAGEAGIPEAEALKLAAPMSGGKMGKCGAVLAAEKVLESRFGVDRAEALIRDFEHAFIQQHGSVLCRDLISSCRACVTDASLLLEERL
ncbi:MAG: C_GCAxxG_C_C family protein [Oscillospiraceae bacterium]|nr:C_GCAxxG_C_C family protein [Oscillospiraceae bacterium]